jgi:ZU5 domain
MTAIQRICALVLAGAWCVGCSSDNGAEPDDGGADVATPTGDSAPASDDAATATQTIGAAGGVVAAPGIDLTIPAGALASDTTISITPNAGPVPTGYTALSRLYAFGPDGTVFLKPVTVNFALASSGPNPTVYWSNATGGYDPLATTVTAGAATASVTHFSTGFVAVGPATDDGGADATTTPDATVADAPTGDDATAANDSSVGSDDASASDASETSDVSVVDAGASDSAVADSAAADAADAGLDGITATVDTVATVFASSPSAVYSNGISTIQANDNASTTHWQLQIVVLFNEQQEACSSSSNYPGVTYTHFTGSVADQVFSAKNQTGSCDLIVTHVAEASGQATTGSLSATVYEGVDAGTASHVFTEVSFNVTM